MTQSTATPLAPNTDDSTKVLTDNVNANAIITAYCHSLLNIQIDKLKDQGSWYDEFNASLKVAQGHADDWINDLSPKVFSKVPQTIIDYGNVFNAAMKRINDIINSVPDGAELSKTQSDTIIRYLEAVLADLGIQQKTISDVRAQLIKFNSDVQADHTALLTGQNSAQSQVLMDQKQLAIIQAKINSIQTQMQADSQAAMASEIGLGVAIFITVVAFAAAVATGGVSLGIGAALAVGVLGVGGAIAGTVIFSKKVNEDLDELYAEQQNMNDEQRQVSALQGVVTSIQTLVTSNEAATLAISAVLNTWAVLQGKLQAVIDNLKQAESDAATMMGLLVGLDIDVATTSWAQLVDFATNMQKSSLTIQVNVIEQPNPPVKQAA